MDTPILDCYSKQIRLSNKNGLGEYILGCLGNYHRKYISKVLSCRSDEDLQALNMMYLKVCKHMTADNLMPDNITYTFLVDDTLARVKQKIAEDVYTSEWKPKLYHYDGYFSSLACQYRSLITDPIQRKEFTDYCDKVRKSLKTLPEYVQQKEAYRAIRTAEVIALPPGENKNARIRLLDDIFGSD